MIKNTCFTDENVPVCAFKTSPFVPAPRAHVFQHVCAWCWYTRGRFERTHGDVLSGHTEFRSVSHTNTHTLTHTTQHITTQHITPQHHTEKDRDRERRQGQREKRRRKRRDKTREEKTKEDRREKWEDSFFSVVVHGFFFLVYWFVLLIPFAHETWASQTVSSTIHFRFQCPLAN